MICPAFCYNQFQKERPEIYRGEGQKMERMPAVKQGPVRKRITAGTAALFALLLVLTLVSCGESGTGGKNGNTANTAETGPALETRSVRILATSDLHGKFMPWDYYMNEESTKGSAAQLSAS